MTYSSSLAVGRQRFAQSADARPNNQRTTAWGKNQNTTNFSDKRRLGPVSNTIMLIVLTCLLGLLYLTQVTKANAYGYKINTLSEERNKLQGEHDQLEVAAARLQAVERVKNSAAAKALVSVAPQATLQN
ncbi:MAG: hypothetical protein KIH63_002000 [Candidatus Saccharibacteria bacterium]|nr:hypothetical protein [Candidatus Saccharibacteria bacterium]